MTAITLAPGAEENAFATMLADLVQQNLESKPHKRADFNALSGTFALIADDAEVAVTLEFKDGLTLHDGIYHIPDVAIRGSAEAIMALSNVPLTRRFALPVPTDQPSYELVRSLLQAVRAGELRIHGAFAKRQNLQMLSRLTRVMSVNG
jgi:hypothetical protein